MIRQRALFQSRRRSLCVLGALVLLCLALAWAHSAPMAHEMGDDGGHAAQVLSICLAVFQAATLLTGAIAGTSLIARRRPPRRLLPRATAPAGSGVAQPARWPRAGPQVLQVFLR